MIIERLILADALHLCKALNISSELAYQFHIYDLFLFYDYASFNDLYDSRYKGLLKPNLAKALVWNSKFQLLANAKQKVTFSMQSQDLDAVRIALDNWGASHDKCYTLKLACRYGRLDLVKLLVIEYRIHISAYENIALFEACKHGHIDILNYILASPNFYQKDRSFISRELMSPPFHDRHANVLSLLLADGRFDPSDENNQAIITAAKNGNVEIVKILLKDHRVDPSAQNNNAIVRAAENGNLEIVKLLLLDPRVNPSDQNNQAIIEASRTRHLEIVQLLLSDPRIDLIYDYKIRKVIKPHLAKALLKNSSFQLNANANDKVKYAILSQDLELVKRALEDPIVDHTDMRCTPIQYACEFGQLKVVKLLVNEYGIKISARRNMALSETCNYGHLDIFKYILSHPDFNPEECSGALIVAASKVPNIDQKAIEDASENGSEEFLKLLLADPRVDPSSQNNRALRYAAEKGNVEIMKLLLTAIYRAQLEACDKEDLDKVFDLMNYFSDDDNDYYETTSDESI